MKQTVIFLHIPKTAGNTLRAVLSRECGKSRFYYRDGGDLGRLEAFKADYKAEGASLGVVGGHVYFGFHKYMSGPWRYLTMLREPVSRVVSQYRYILSGQSGAWLDGKLDGVGLLEFVERGLDETSDNCQVRRLAGFHARYEEHPYGSAPDLLLEQAWQHVVENRMLVGLQREFDRSLLHFRKELGWRFPPFYRSKNVTKPIGTFAKEKEGPSCEEVNAIRYRNRLDLELYQRIEGSFDTVRRDIPDGMVRRFRSLNRMINRLMSLRKAFAGN